MELKDLLNGTYWLLNVCGLTVTDYYVIHDKIDPINDSNQKFNIHLMEELCANHELFERKNIKENDLIFLQDNINIESQLITQKVIDKYGEQFFIDFINTKDLFKWQLLYKKI